MATQDKKEVVKLQYTCPALPPHFVNANLVYEYGKDEKGYYFANGDNKTYAELWFIKMLFSPVNNSWDKEIK